MADYIEDDDLVILGDREEAQMQAIRSNASCIIIGGGLEVAEEDKKLAEKRGLRDYHNAVRHHFPWRV